MEHAASLDSLPVHFSCPFTGWDGNLCTVCMLPNDRQTAGSPAALLVHGCTLEPAPRWPLLHRRAVCRCLCGTGLALQDGSASSAEQHMRRARAVWRTLHHPGGSIPGGSDPAVLWLPKLVKRGQQQQGQRAGGGEGAGPHAWVQPATPGEAAAAVQRAEAAVQQAEAAARAAVLRAASLAAAVGLPYRPPPALGTLGAALDAEVAGLARVRALRGWAGLAVPPAGLHVPQVTGLVACYCLCSLTATARCPLDLLSSPTAPPMNQS
jgi:hypothetical protein